MGYPNTLDEYNHEHETCKMQDSQTVTLHEIRTRQIHESLKIKVHINTPSLKTKIYGIHTFIQML